MPRFVWLAPALLLPLAISGPNESLSLYAIAVLTAGLHLLWRPAEPPILLFVFVYQWLQSATGALYGNVIGLPLADVVPWHGRHELAVGLMLTGTLVLAVAMRAAAGGPVRNFHTRINAIVGAHPVNLWLRIYVAAWVFSATCGVFAGYAGGLRLPLLTLSGAKWVAFVLLTLAAFSEATRGGRKIWLLVFAFEFALSVGGFFANFKDVFLYALFGLAASKVRISGRTFLMGALFGVALLSLGFVWTAIKGDYRSFVNAGTGRQIVLVDYQARVRELGRLIAELDAHELQKATHEFCQRLMYHHFFAAAAANVPSSLPYAAGQIWGEAVLRPFMPRLLFPQKRDINDSDLTNQYTGLGVATSDQGTSISLGYMAEAYIDFGPVLMFAAIALLGAALGGLYRWLVRRHGQKAILGAALAPFALMPAHLAETSILKMIPSLFLSAIACVAFLGLLAPLAFGGAFASRSIGNAPGHPGARRFHRRL